MTTVNLHDLTRDELTDHLAAMFKQVLPSAEYRRLFVPMLRALATAQPVEPERLAALAEVPLERTLDLLRRAPSEWDPSGKGLVGLGLTSNPTPHRFEVHGHTLWAWVHVASRAPRGAAALRGRHLRAVPARGQAGVGRGAAAG